MGVTLERVQFKFASIIGELCSEPDILSQFAVWVDLRLAEYKLKGSISLDCSGDPPDPVWLKGILTALLEKKFEKEKQTAAHALEKRKRLLLQVDKPLCHSTPIARRTGDPKTSQPQDIDLIEFSRTSHTNTDSNNPASFLDFRKRRAPETLTQHNSDGYNSHAPYKFRRKEGTENDPITVSHESLMSIINVNTVDSSLVKCEPDAQDNDTDIITLEANEPQSHSDHQSFHIIHGEDSQENTAAWSDTSWLNNSSDLIKNQSRKEKAVESTRRIRSDVNSFQAWLFTSSYEDSRPIEQIAVVELDLYLAEFFTTTKTRSGADYDPNSLGSVRSCLERHLKEQGYPYSISCSPEFSNSQAAFKAKKSILKLANVITTEDVVVLRQKQLLGPFTPRSLLNVLYWRISDYTILKSKVDHFNLLWGDVELVQSEDGSERLLLTGNTSRTLQKPVSFMKILKSDTLIVPAVPEDPTVCPVQMYKEYQRHRPASARGPLSSFYLRPALSIDSEVWYLDVSLGLHHISSLVREMKEAADISMRGDHGQPNVPWKRVEQLERMKFREIQTRSYVNKFEKWAQLNPRCDFRKMEDMPPEVLDPYLVEFLSTVTSSRTGAMGVNSLIALRSGLERHLKKVKYPHSIISSYHFITSQQAYKTRKGELHDTSTANCMTLLGRGSQNDDLIPAELLSESL